MPYIGIDFLMKRLGQRGNIPQKVVPPSMSFWRVSMSCNISGHRPKAQIGGMKGQRSHLRGTAAPSVHEDNQPPIPPSPSDNVFTTVRHARSPHAFLFGG